MTLRIIDIETTGTDRATDAIIEIASVDLRELDDLAVPIDYQESTIRDFASPITSGHMRFPCSQTGRTASYPSYGALAPTAVTTGLCSVGIFRVSPVMRRRALA